MMGERMDDTMIISALDPSYPAWREFSAGRPDLIALWFLTRSSTPGGSWMMGYKWWLEGERFDRDVATRLGSTMRECVLSGELADMIFVHNNPSVEPETEIPRMTLLFRELADFLLYSGGVEAQAA